MCVGCGRCRNVCPEYISYVACLQKRKKKEGKKILQNEYIPLNSFLSKIKEIVKHTETEYTFRMTYVGEVKPGQFFEVSIPKYGEAPISVSGIGEDYVDLTIRKVGKVTGEIFELNEESSFFMRGPYGNGFEKENYQGKEADRSSRWNRSISCERRDQLLLVSIRMK